MSTPEYEPDFKCGTFDPKIRALITPAMRAKMDADRERAIAERKAKEIRDAGCECCGGKVEWFESVCATCAKAANE